MWLVLVAVLAVGCNEDFDTPPIVMPRASYTPNMSIADFKAKYWNDARNFCDTIKDDVVIHGWVSANDESGNVYKYLFIQDETAGIGLSIDASSLAGTYRIGQEVVLNMKNRWIGKWNGQYLIGKPEWYAAQNVWEAGRMPLELVKEFLEINGLPNKSKVNPVVAKISDVVGHSDKETKLKYMGQLVKFQNVKWDAADGTVPFSEADASTERMISDKDGNSIKVENSNYASFRAEPLPLGTGDVVGILKMVGEDQWSLVIRDLDDCIGFANGTKGTQNDPYTVAEAIENQNTSRAGWMTGYVVGAVAPEVTEVKSNADIEWTAPTSLPNTIVIADNPDETDFSKCIVVPLPQDTRFRTKANLRDNPDVYKTQIWVKGTFATFMGTHGITGNSGSTDEFRLSVGGGVTTIADYIDLDENAEFTFGGEVVVAYVSPSDNRYLYIKDSTGSALIYGQGITSGFKQGDVLAAGWTGTKSNYNGLYEITNVTGLTATGGTQTVKPVEMTTADITTANQNTYCVLRNVTIASVNGRAFTFSDGSAGYNTFQNDVTLPSDLSKTYDIEGIMSVNRGNPQFIPTKFLTGGDTPGPGPGPDPDLADNRADFETMNGGTAKGTYGTLTSKLGWTATNSNLLIGGETDNSQTATFAFIGKMPESNNWAMAVTINGNTTKVGTIVSPVIKGGIASLMFNYAIPYTDVQIAFRVDVKQNGQTVYTHTVEQSENTGLEKFKVFTFNERVNVTGDCTIEFTNLCPSQDAKNNKDRVSIWNVTWVKP